MCYLGIAQNGGIGLFPHNFQKWHITIQNNGSFNGKVLGLYNVIITEFHDIAWKCPIAIQGLVYLWWYVRLEN